MLVNMLRGQNEDGIYNYNITGPDLSESTQHLYIESISLQPTGLDLSESTQHLYIESISLQHYSLQVQISVRVLNIST